MKAMIVIWITLLLTSCTAASMTQLESAPRPKEPPKMIEAMKLVPAERKEVIRYEVETILYGDTERTEQGEHLVTYTFNTPRLTAYREDGTPISGKDAGPTVEAKKAETDAELHALAVTEAFNEKFEEWATFTGFAALAAGAAEDLAWRQAEGLDWYGGYFLELDCTVYQTDHLISVSGLYYSYTGGAHPNTCMLSWNFDLEEGSFFGPELLAEDTGLQEAVTAEIIRQANLPLEDGTVPAEWYWADYEAIAANWSSYAVTFDETGMMVLFSPYEIAAYAYGTQEFHLPYTFLEPYLSAHGRVVLEREPLG